MKVKPSRLQQCIYPHIERIFINRLRELSEFRTLKGSQDTLLETPAGVYDSPPQPWPGRDFTVEALGAARALRRS